MSLVTAEGLEIGFGGRRLLDGVDLRIGEEDRIGLVGRNGTGKSTLMRVLAGRVEPDGGSIRFAGAARSGYLPQEIEIEGGSTLIDSVLDSVPGRSEVEQMLAGVEEELTTATDEQEQLGLSQKLVDLHDELAHFEAHFSRHEAVRILAGLGFAETDLPRDLSEFSGGWKMRAVLAGLLYQKPDLLLLDEPTNHLDVPSVAWLGGFLARWKGAMVLVCHDREFLNEQINRVVSYEIEGLRQYTGNYERYLLLRAEEREVLDRRATNIAREREHAERFINRFRAQANKAKAVQSRVKMLEKMDEVARLREGGTLSFRFPACARAGGTVLSVEKLSHSYGELKVLSDLNLQVRRGDRVAIVGPNGAGKTTLLKILAGELDPSTGSLRSGANVKAGYYAQHVTDKLHPSATVLDEVYRASSGDDMVAVRNVLGTFFFSGDDVDKKIAVLSGGEKARVALACMMVNPGNLLLMDEPTNHLDLGSAEALAEAMATFGGTMIFVSHNRAFVNRLATRIWDIEAGHLEEYPGKLKDYMERFRYRSFDEEEDAAASQQPAGGKAAGKQVIGKKTAGKKRAAAAEKTTSTEPSLSRNEERRLQRDSERLEKRISELEHEQAERGQRLSDPDVYGKDDYQELLGNWQATQEKLEELIGRWERNQQQLGDTGSPG